MNWAGTKTACLLMRAALFSLPQSPGQCYPISFFSFFSFRHCFTHHSDTLPASHSSATPLYHIPLLDVFFFFFNYVLLVFGEKNAV